MESVKKQIESIDIPSEYIPKNNDYKRGFCLYELQGYIQPKYIVYNETLDSFNEESNLYKYGINILRKYSLNPDEWTLLYEYNPDWLCRFKLIKI